MERQRYELTLRYGSADSVFWTNRLEEVEPLLALACSGAQSDQRMALAVRDTTTGARAECANATSIGFHAMTRALLGSIGAAQPRPLREGDGRDVVVEVQFAAHDATLQQCRDFVCAAMSAAMERHASDEPADMVTGRAAFSYNGPTVGDAWFE
jgi:hypothetical protein